jgi:hypothetical protein
VQVERSIRDNKYDQNAATYFLMLGNVATAAAELSTLFVHVCCVAAVHFIDRERATLASITGAVNQQGSVHLKGPAVPGATLRCIRSKMVRALRCSRLFARRVVARMPGHVVNW